MYIHMHISKCLIYLTGTKFDRELFVFLVCVLDGLFVRMCTCMNQN